MRQAEIGQKDYEDGVGTIEGTLETKKHVKGGDEPMPTRVEGVERTISDDSMTSTDSGNSEPLPR